jgi:type I restriction enzyme S subunit
MLQQNLNMMNIGTSQPLLTQNILSRIKCILPCISAIEKYNSIAKTLFNQMQALASQSISLAVIRDTLLPKMMSGELPVTAFKDTLE